MKSSLEINKKDWLVISGFNATLTTEVISWWSVTHICVCWLSHTSTNTTFLSKAIDYFSHICFCRGKRRKYAGKKSRLDRGLNLQPAGHVSNMLTTEPPGRANKKEVCNKE